MFAKILALFKTAPKTFVQKFEGLKSEMKTLHDDIQLAATGTQALIEELLAKKAQYEKVISDVKQIIEPSTAPPAK